MNDRSRAWVRLAGVVALESAVLYGCWRAIVGQTAAINQTVNSISDLKDPSPYRGALLGHLGKIHLALQGYLRSLDASLERQLVESRQDFEAALPEFQRENSRLFPPAANEEIRSSFSLYKESIDRTMEASRRRADHRALLDQNFGQMIFLIERQLRPLIRREQPDGEERTDSVLNIENQLRAWQQNLAHAWRDPTDNAKALPLENENRGESHLELYARMQLLPRERKIQRDVQRLWQANSDLSRESFVLENGVAEAEKACDAERLQVVGTLNRLLPAMPPAELQARKDAYVRAMRLHLAGAVGIGLLGLITLVIAVVLMYRSLRNPPPVAARAPGASTPHEPTVQMDLSGTIAVWSPSASSLYGYASGEMKGQSIAKLFESESEISRLYHQLKHARDTAFETTHKTKAGAPIRVRIEFRELTDKTGQASGIGLICTRRP
ncbi:MAG TPA: PAS domain-containing protein [Elusimicrobiota bacterium]|nr:PAS domain-containing protein [Elusimicrobiota bacterium]